MYYFFLPSIICTEPHGSHFLLGNNIQGSPGSFWLGLWEFGSGDVFCRLCPQSAYPGSGPCSPDEHLGCKHTPYWAEKSGLLWCELAPLSQNGLIIFLFYRDSFVQISFCRHKIHEHAQNWIITPSLIVLKLCLSSVILSWVAHISQSKAASRTMGFLKACLVAWFGARGKLDLLGISNEMTPRRSRMESASLPQPSEICWWVSWQLTPSGRILRHLTSLSTSADALSHQTSHLQERLGMCVPEKHFLDVPLIQVSKPGHRAPCPLCAYLNYPPSCLWWPPFCSWLCL